MGVSYTAHDLTGFMMVMVLIKTEMNKQELTKVNREERLDFEK